MKLLTQNSDLKKTGIYGWTLPAHWVKLSNGHKFNTCPSAGICAAFCYAKSGTYQFKNVKKAHIEKLELVLNDMDGWAQMMIDEIRKPQYTGKYIRIHDSGDFFSADYILKWFHIARSCPSTTFYTYTKEVRVFKGFEKLKMIPKNFIVIYSFGGKDDNLIDRNKDRHSDVFPDYQAMIEAGYVDIAEDDKQAAINPNHCIGLYRNNIPHLVKKQGRRTFGEWQETKLKDKGND